MSQGAQRRSIDRVLDALSGPSAPLTVPDLAPRAGRLLDGAGAGVAVGGDLRRGGVLVALSATGLGEAGEDLQTTLGEGPAYTAHRTGRPVSVPDLDDDITWVMFGNDAAELGIGSVFSFPLRQARTTLGALTLYRRQPGELTTDQRDDATTLAGFVAGYLTHDHDEQADHSLPPGEPGSGAINQATGMVAAQLGLDMVAALDVLRARALGTYRPLHEVAREIVGRRLRLEELWC